MTACDKRSREAFSGLAEELEESRDGYVVSPLEEEGSITESGRDPVVEFVNRKIQPSDPEHGTLTVTKAVTGTDERKAFTFTVRLRDGLGRPIPGEYRYDGARSGMISDGGKVMLGHGESITIYGFRPMPGITWLSRRQIRILT